MIYLISKENNRKRKVHIYRAEDILDDCYFTSCYYEVYKKGLSINSWIKTFTLNDFDKENICIMCLNNAKKNNQTKLSNINSTIK